MLLVARSATSKSSGFTQLVFRLNLPDMKYYTADQKTTTPVSPRQAFGNIVKRYLVFAALFGLIGFEYRNRFGSVQVGSVEGELTPSAFAAHIL